MTGERDIGRRFSQQNYHWPRNALERYAGRSEENLESVIIRIFHFARTLQDEFAPDAVVSGLIAEPLKLATYMYGRVRGIPFAMNRLSKIHDNRFYWTTGLQMLNDDAAELCETYLVDRREASPQAKDLINAFRDTPKTVQYISENWRNLASSWRTAHTDFVSMTKARLAYTLKRRTGVTPKPPIAHLLHFYRSEYLRWRQRHLYLSLEAAELAKTQYVYLALHKEPELALNHLAPEFHDQLGFIRLLSRALPFGWKLLVREHRFNIGRRSGDYYRSVTSLPSVRLLSPLDSQFKYIKNAGLVVTDNGSTGWEALMLRRPVVVTTRSFYSSCGLTPCLAAPAALMDFVGNPTAQVDPNEDKEHDRKLANMIDAEWETTESIDTNSSGQIEALVRFLARETKKKSYA